VYRRVDKLANNLLTFGRSHSTGRPFFILLTMEFKEVLIDPVYAAHLLEGNDKNRPLKEDLLLRYTDDMRTGKWRGQTGESIKVSKTNRLLDGQHRLNAIIKSGVSVKCLIVYGLDDQVFDVIDTGRGRSGGDTLSVYGIPNAIRVSTSIQVYDRIKNEYAFRRSGARTTKLTNQEVLSKYKEKAGEWDLSIMKAGRWYESMSKCLVLSEICAIYMFLSEIDKQQADSFFNQLCTGDVRDKVILLLRKKLFDDKINKESKMTHDARLALIFKAWNAIRSGVELKTLTYHQETEKRLRPI